MHSELVKITMKDVMVHIYVQFIDLVNFNSQHLIQVTSWLSPYHVQHDASNFEVPQIYSWIFDGFFLQMSTDSFIANFSLIFHVCWYFLSIWPAGLEALLIINYHTTALTYLDFEPQDDCKHMKCWNVIVLRHAVLWFWGTPVLLNLIINSSEPAWFICGFIHCMCCHWAVIISSLRILGN